MASPLMDLLAGPVAACRRAPIVVAPVEDGGPMPTNAVPLQALRAALA